MTVVNTQPIEGTIGNRQVVLFYDWSIGPYMRKKRFKHEEIYLVMRIWHLNDQLCFLWVDEKQLICMSIQIYDFSLMT